MHDLILVFCGITLTLAIISLWASLMLQKERKAFNDELEAAIKTASESHNTLTESIIAMDRKITDVSLRLDHPIKRGNIL